MSKEFSVLPVNNWLRRDAKSSHKIPRGCRHVVGISRRLKGSLKTLSKESQKDFVLLSKKSFLKLSNVLCRPSLLRFHLFQCTGLPKNKGK